MWKRDEGVRPTGATGYGNAPAAPANDPAPSYPRPGSDVTSHQPERDALNNIGSIGKSVVIKGELTASEDLVIEGQVDGKIELRQNTLTIGGNGKIKAQMFAKAVIVQGEVVGNITATEKVDIRDNGSVDGDITSPRVAIAEGAHFRGSIDMQRGGSKAGEKGEKAEKTEAKPAPAAAPASTAATAGAAR